MTKESEALAVFLSACMDGGMNGNNMKKAMAEYIKPPATAPDELERLRQIAHLTGTIFCYGNFVAETHNEAVLEKLLRENGTFWDSVEQYEKSQGWIP